jgi:hypothetical protein
MVPRIDTVSALIDLPSPSTAQPTCSDQATSRLATDIGVLDILAVPTVLYRGNNLDANWSGQTLGRQILRVPLVVEEK